MTSTLLSFAVGIYVLPFVGAAWYERRRNRRA